MEGWSQQAQARHGLRGRARLSVDARGGDLRLRSRQLLVLERPARLRVEVRGLLDQTVAVLVTDGESYQLLRADDRSFETGPVHPGLLFEQAYLDLTPEQAIDLLLGAPAPDAGLVPLAAAAADDGEVRLDLGDRRGRLRRRARFDSRGRLQQLEVFDAEGALSWRADFGDYSPVDGTEFAHAVTLETAGGDTRANISLEDVELNPALPDELFRLRPPPAPRSPGG